MLDKTQEISEKSDRGNTRSRSWMFTLNNYNADDIDCLLLELKNSKSYVFQEEMGKKGTPHLQGYVVWKSQRMFSVLIKINKRIHWEVRRGTHKQAVAYCSKDSTRNGLIYMKGLNIVSTLKDPMTGCTLKNWQKEILNRIRLKPNPRKIYWYWEEIGNVGKTTFCKHLCIKYNAIYICGKASDMKYGIAEWIKKKKLNVVLLDLPRTLEKYISYQGIEEIKNGIFYSPKYESEMCLYDIPHVFIFANFEPDINKLSLDRFVIKKIS